MNRKLRTKNAKTESSEEEISSDATSVKPLSSKKIFRIPSHSDGVLKELNQQRLEGKLCDVTVLVEHQRFRAHKCVLSANSNYFNSLLMNDNDGIFLRHVTAQSFQAILDFMYTSRLQLDPNTLQDVLKASKFLQVKSVVSICCRFLEGQIKQLEKNLGRCKNNDDGTDPVLLSINANLLKPEDPPQQAPHITFDPTTGTFAQSSVPPSAAQHNLQPMINPHQQQQNFPNYQPHHRPHYQPAPVNSGIPPISNHMAAPYNAQPNGNFYHGSNPAYASKNSLPLPPTGAGVQPKLNPVATHHNNNNAGRRPPIGASNAAASNKHHAPPQQPGAADNRGFPSLSNGRSMKRNFSRRAAPGGAVSDTESLNAIYADPRADHGSGGRKSAISREKTATTSHHKQQRDDGDAIAEDCEGRASPPVITLSIATRSIKSSRSIISVPSSAGNVVEKNKKCWESKSDRLSSSKKSDRNSASGTNRASPR